MGLNGIVSFSSDSNTLERSEKFGFRKVPGQTIIALGLGD